MAKVGGQPVEILVQSIAGEDKQTIWCQSLLDLVDELAGIGNRATTDVHGQDELASGRHGGPHPHPFGLALDLRDQFIQLNMANDHHPEEQPLVQAGAVDASPLQPAADGGVVMAEDALAAEISTPSDSAVMTISTRISAVLMWYMGVCRRLVLRPPPHAWQRRYRMSLSCPRQPSLTSAWMVGSAMRK
jgi:hypothetical protein